MRTMHNTLLTMTASAAAPTVAIIGAGPGGMFFCHALETYRQELEEKGDSVDNLPQAVCLERAPGPGR